MSSRYHGPMRYMGNFKAVAIDYEYYLSLSNVPQSVCLTERQMYIILVQNTYTYWATRWYNIDDVSEAELKTIAAELEELMMCGCGIPEPTITDRKTAQTYITDTATSYETTYNTWNTAGQTVASIAPNLDYSSGSTANKDKLLCLALQMLVIDIVEAAKANKQGTGQQNKDMVKNLGNTFGALATAGGSAIAVGGAAAAFVSFLGGPYLVMGLALAAVGLAVANLVYTTDLSVFEDQDAVDAISCTLNNNLIGATPTRARFQGGLSPNAFPSGSNAEKLAAVVQPFLDDLDTYLNWLATANGLYDVSDFGILPECDICTEEIALTPFGYGGQLFGTFPSIVNNGIPFLATSTTPTGSYATDRIICMIFDQACTVTINSLTDWDYCNIAPSDALYGYCPTSLDPNNLANYVFTRRSSGATTIPMPWNQAANGIWLEGCIPSGQFVVNMELNII